MRGSEGQCVYDVSGIRQLSPGYLDIGGNATLNIGGRSTYILFPLYENRIQSRASVSPLRPNNSGVTINGAIVEVLNEQRQREYGPVFMPGTTFVPGATTAAPGQQVGSLDLLPSEYATALKSQVTGDQQKQIFFSVVAVGETDGGIEVKAPTFLWPVKVCAGCLWRCAASGETAEQGCTPGQDETGTIKCD